MAISTRLLPYEIDGKTYEGFFAIDDEVQGPRPCVLIFHAIYGRSDHEEDVAIRLAEQGYAAMAADMFGQGILSMNPEEMVPHAMPLFENRDELFKRGNAALSAMTAQSEADASKAVAIGYCFGGLSVFDMARRNASVAGVVGFHGIMAPAPESSTDPILPKVLTIIGHDDPQPFEGPDAAKAFAEEMNSRQADWQCHTLGNTVHGFTIKASKEPEKGIAYNALSERRSWKVMLNFLEECSS